MANLNKVILIGNLTHDPELVTLPSGGNLCRLSLACNRRFKRQNGEVGEETLFIDCTAFGRTGELIHQYLTKGRPALVEGRLKLDRWDDKEGNHRSKHQIVIETFQFINRRQDSGETETPIEDAPARSQEPPLLEGDIPF